jgi:hypothetical protein
VFANLAGQKFEVTYVVSTKRKEKCNKFDDLQFCTKSNVTFPKSGLFRDISNSECFDSSKFFGYIKSNYSNGMEMIMHFKWRISSVATSISRVLA